MLKIQIVRLFLLIGFMINCNPFASNSKNDWGLFALLSLGGASSSDPSVLPEPINASTKPNIVLPPIFGGESTGFKATESTDSVPSSVKGNYVPIGKIYDVGLNWSQIEGLEEEEFQTIRLGTPVELRYSYDKEALYKSGFLEEFMVFYYDSSTQEWLPVSGVRIDYENNEVIALTDHFTPFVLTALPIPQGTGVSTAPACIANESPISGSGNATWTVVGENFKYYKDRNYIIQTNADFYSLGFENALGIATCNGGTPQAGLNNCGLFSEHKNYSGINYIQFQAPKPINVFVMYDSRGPNEATWLANEGWTDTGMNIETTDAVGQYKVFAKAFSTNEQVSIHGNWNGISAATNINTNLWVVVKEQGGSYYSTPSDVCQNGNTGIAKLENVFGIPGSNKNTLLWELPETSNIQNILIRRQFNFPTLSPNGGQAVTGIEIGENGYSDLGLNEGLTYYYSIFTLDQNGSYSTAKVIELTTGVDNDGDGIKDGFELNPDHIYDSGLPTFANNADSDGDGINDLQEIIDQTDPRNPDAIKPVINNFTLTSESPTQMPIAFFNLNATDNIGITHWVFTSTNKKPRKNNPNWTDVKPSYSTLESMQTYDFYVWAKDAAGNISNVYSPVQVVLDGLKYPKFVFAADYDSTLIKTYKYNLSTKSLQLVQSYNTGVKSYNLAIHPLNLFLVSSGLDSKIIIYNIDQNTGVLTKNQELVRTSPTHKFEFDKDGKYLYSSETEWENALPYGFIRTYQVNLQSNTITPFSRSKIGNRGIEDFSISPLNDKIAIGSTGGNDRCSYTIRQLIDGVVYGQIAESNIIWETCYKSIFDNSGRYIYTSLDSKLTSFFVNGTNFLFTNKWSIPNSIIDSIYNLPFKHPNGKFFYRMRSNFSDKIFIDTFEIEANSELEGRLNPIGNSYEINIPSGRVFRNGQVDPSGNSIYFSDENKNIFTVLLNKSSGLPISYKFITTSNINSLIATSSVNNTNEPPIANVETNGGAIYSFGKTMFPNICLIASNTPSPFWPSSYCSAKLTARDQDSARCNTTSDSLDLNLSITGNGITNQFLYGNYTHNNNKYTSLNAKFNSTGNFNFDYSVTDQVGSCQGQALTTSGTQNIVVKRPKVGPQISIPETENRNPTPFKKFRIDEVYQWGHVGASSYTLTRKTCELFWRECSITAPINEIGNIFALRLTCDFKSKLDVQYVRNGSGQTCKQRFPNVIEFDVLVLGMFIVDRGSSTTRYYNGRWIELED